MSVLPLSYTPGPKQILKRKHTDNVDTIWLALGEKQEWRERTVAELGILETAGKLSPKGQGVIHSTQKKEAQKSPTLFFFG